MRGVETIEVLETSGWRRRAVRRPAERARAAPPPLSRHPEQPDIELELHNDGPETIGLPAHAHLAEVHPAIRLDRAAAHGFRPALAAGDRLVLAPGERAVIRATAFRGARLLYGHRGAVNGPLDPPITHLEDEP